MSIKSKISTLFRPYRNRKRQDYFLKKYGPVKEDFIILSNNCIGGMCYHDANKPFLSPTINLCVEDFLTFIANAKQYISCEMERVEENECEYPVGVLVPTNNLPKIKIYFVHYESFDEAKKKWKERCERMYSSNAKLCIIYCVPKNKAFGDKEIKEFLSINAYRKLCFYRELNEFIPKNTSSTCFVQIPKKYQSIDYSKYTGLFSRKRYFDRFFNIFSFLFK